MTDEKTSIPLLRTKLHRPRVVRNHLHRQHLLDRLDQSLQRPLTLVSVHFWHAGWRRPIFQAHGYP